jgi:hypothetical protein
MLHRKARRNAASARSAAQLLRVAASQWGLPPVEETGNALGSAASCPASAAFPRGAWRIAA